MPVDFSSQGSEIAVSTELLDPNAVPEDDEEESPSRSDLAQQGLRAEGERGVLPELVFPLPDSHLYGIDVSHWQGDIKWSQVPPTRVLFAVTKCSEGCSVDKRFAQNWAELARQRDAARASGRTFLRGAYHFFRVDKDPIKQASIFVKLIGNLCEGDLPPTLDVEWSYSDVKNLKNDRWDLVSQAERGKRIKRWLRAVEDALGVAPIVYTNYSFWSTKIGALAGLEGNRLWLADYSGKSRSMGKPQRIPAPWSRWHFWQLSDNGTVAGISTAVDVNRFVGGLDDLQEMSRRVAVEAVGAPARQQFERSVPHEPAHGPQEPSPSSARSLAPLPPPPLRRGDHGAEIGILQNELMVLGHMQGPERASGFWRFGAETCEALTRFQHANQLPETGDFDVKTNDAFKTLRRGLRKGDSGPLVEALQRRLVARRLMTEAVFAAGIGQFGPKTEAALIQFQERGNLRPTGILDQETYSRLINA